MHILEHDFDQITVDEIGKFAILWNVFEKTKCGSDCDSQKLINLGNNDAIRTIADVRQIFARALQRRMNLFHVAATDYVENHLQMRLGRNLSPEHKQLICNFIQSNGLECISGGLLAIYRLRNNMFHGLKEWWDLDSQVELFASMNKVLEGILSCQE